MTGPPKQHSGAEPLQARWRTKNSCSVTRIPKMILGCQGSRQSDRTVGCQGQSEGFLSDIAWKGAAGMIASLATRAQSSQLNTLKSACSPKNQAELARPGRIVTGRKEDFHYVPPRMGHKKSDSRSVRLPFRRSLCRRPARCLHRFPHLCLWCQIGPVNLIHQIS